MQWAGFESKGWHGCAEERVLRSAVHDGDEMAPSHDALFNVTQVEGANKLT